MKIDEMEKHRGNGVNTDFYKSIIESSPSGYAYHKIILDENNNPCDYEFIEVNAAFEKLAGLKRSDILGKNISGILPDIKKSEFNWIKFYGDIALNGGCDEFEQFSEPLNRWYKVKAYSPEKYYFVTHFIDMDSEYKYYSLFESSHDAILIADLESKTIIDANKNTTQLLGFKHEELLGKSIFELHITEKKEDILEIINKLKINEKDGYCFEITVNHNDGRIIPVEISTGKSFVWNDKTLVVGFFRDITERKQAEDKLRESEERYHSFIQNSSEGIYRLEMEKPLDITLPVESQIDWIYDNAYIAECNMALVAMYKADSPADVIGKRLIDFHGGRNNTINRAEVRSFVEANYRTVNNETIEIATDGTTVYFSNSDISIIENGFVKRVWGIQADITKRKQMEKSVYKEKEQFKTTLLSVGDGVISTDNQGNVMVLNKIAEKLTGWTQNEALGRPMEEVFNIINEFTRERCKNPVYKVLETGDTINLSKHTILISRDGSERPIEDSAAPIKDENGNIYGVVLVFRDFTEKKQIELEILRAKDAAEEASAAKSRFLANMSHEIRTPLNGVLGMLQLMQLTEINEEQKELIHICRASADGLLVVINDILDYSKIASGKIELVKVPFEIKDLINSAVRMFMHSAREKGLIIEVSIENNFPDELIGDQFRLRQIIINLVGNAVKFSDNGRIEVSVKKIEEQSNKEKKIEEQSNKEIMLEFAVKDTGIGIPPEKIELLFTSFSQFNTSNTRTYGGSGLGLAISKNLVELMNGKMWAESIEGEGSSFYFTCVLEKTDIDASFTEPLAEKQVERLTEKLAEKQVENTKGKSILLIEDNEVSRTVIEKFAIKKGWKVTIAENGKKGFEIFKQKKFDIVLMDVQMPIMNGYTATSFMRALEWTKGIHTPIIAMTAFALKGDRDKCLEAGMDDYLSKPVNINEFYEIVERWTK